MADTKLGGVYYEVDARTDGLLQLQSKVNKTTDGIAKDFNKADKVVSGATGRMSTQMTKTGTAVNGALKGMGRSAGQAGIQIQQLVGQIQGGQSAFVALSQQSADLGFVLGAPLVGVMVSLAAVAGGVLFNALSSAADKADTLEEAMKRLGDAVEITDDGVALLTEEVRKLAAVSQDAAMAQLAQEIIDAKNVINAATKEVKTAYSDLTTGLNLSVITTQIDRYKAAISEGGEAARIAIKGITQRPDLETKDSYAALEQSIRGVSKQFSISRESAFEFIQAISSVSAGGGPAEIQNLQNVVSRLSKESGFTNKELAKFQNRLSEVFSSARTAGEMMSAAEGFIADFGTALEKSTKSSNEQKTSLDQLMSRVKDMAFTYGMSEKGVALYVAEQLNATEAQKETIKAYFDAIDAAKEDIEAKKKATDETEKAIASYEKLKQRLSEQVLEMQDSDAAFEAYILQQRAAAEAAGQNADEIESLIRLQKQLKTEQDSAGRLEKLEQEIQLQQIRNSLGNDEYEIRAAIAALGENATQSEVDRITALVTQMQALRTEAELLGPTLEQSFGDTVLSSLDQLSQGLADIIANGASAREVFSSLASTILNELLSSIIRYYIGQAAAAVAASATSTAASAAATTAGVAEAAILTAAWTPAAIAANIATFGAAATAAAATAPLAAAATVAAVASGSVAGGRLYGGPVSSGSIYPITENGKPEILQQGNRQYLLPGTGGNVISNKDMMSAGGSGVNVTVNVNNSSSANVDVQRRQGADRSEIIDIVVADIQGRGRVQRAITSTTTASNKI